MALQADPNVEAGLSEAELSGTILQSAESLEVTRQLVTAEGPRPGNAPKITGYALERLLGRGAFAEVWQARQIRSGKPVAIKVFARSGGVNLAFLQREVDRLIRLDKHPHIVSLLDADLGANPPYLVTDLLGAGSLEAFVRSGALAPPARLLVWMEGIADALAYVHAKGIIHCDLKPSNLLLDDTGRIRVADFGQARVVTDTGGALGTLFYMAPEQAVLARHGESLAPDVRWDVYGLGATMYALLTGRVPYETPLTQTLVASPTLDARLTTYREYVRAHPLRLRAARERTVDPDLAAIVDRCLEADPRRRYHSIEAVLADLKARRELRPVSPLAHDPWYLARKFLRRHVKVVSLAAVATAGLAALFAQVVREKGRVTGELASSYFLRAQEYAGKGADDLAATYYAASNRLQPTRAARVNALAHLAAIELPVRVLEPGGWVAMARFLPGGERLLTQTHDATLQIWDARAGTRAGKPMAHAKGIRRGWAVSADGRWVCSATDLDAARVFDAASGEPVGKPLDTAKTVRAVAFSPDGRLVATGDEGGGVAVWNVPEGTKAAGLLQHPDGVWRAAFTPDGRHLFTACHDGAVRRFDVRAPDRAPLILRHGTTVSLLALSSDGTRLASGSDRGTVRLWDARSGGPLGPEMVLRAQPVDLAFSPDGGRLVTGDEEGWVRFWDGRTGRQIAVPGRHDAAVSSVAFSPDGRLVVTSSWDRSVRLWDPDTGEAVGRIRRHPRGAWDAQFSPDGRRLVTASYDATARLWDLAPEELHRASPWIVPGLAWFAFTRDGARLLTAGWDGEGRLWEVASGRAVGGPLPYRKGLMAMGLTPDASHAVMAGWDGTIRFWDPRTAAPAAPARSPANGIKTAAASHDGRRLIVADGNSAVRCWDGITGAPLGRSFVHAGGVSAVAVSADGARAASVGWEKSLVLWDGRRGERAGVPVPLPEYARDLIFSADGSRLVLVGYETLTVREGGTGRVVLGPPLLSGYHEAAISPDGRWLAAAAWDDSVRIWDLESGEPVERLLRDETGIQSMAFSPDGLTLLVGSNKRVARLYDTVSGWPVGNPVRSAGQVAITGFTPDGRTALVSGNEDHALHFRDVSWLDEPATSDEVLRRTQVASQFRLDAAGAPDPLPLDAWRALRGTTGSARR